MLLAFTVIKVLMKLNLSQMNILSEYFAEKQQITMVDAVDNSTSGNLRSACFSRKIAVGTHMSADSLCVVLF